MKIKCGNCGKSIVVPDGLAVGQHVRCPYCNEKSALDKPSRIELPDGFEVKRHSRAKIDELKRKREQANAAADHAPEEQKPKLAVRRPAQQQTKDREHMNAAAAAVDARVRNAERKRRMAKLKKAFGNLISIVTLFALLWIGVKFWKHIQQGDKPEQLTDRVTQLISNAVEKVNGEIAK